MRTWVILGDIFEVSWCLLRLFTSKLWLKPCELVGGFGGLKFSKSGWVFRDFYHLTGLKVIFDDLSSIFYWKIGHNHGSFTVRWNRYIVRRRTIVRRCIIQRRLALPSSHYRTTPYYNATKLFKTLFSTENKQSGISGVYSELIVCSAFNLRLYYGRAINFDFPIQLDISYLTTSNV